MAVGDLEKFLQRAESYHLSAQQEIQAGRINSGKKFLLLSAENLLLSSHHCDGVLKDHRIEIAKKLVQQAENLKEKPSRSFSTTTFTPNSSTLPLDINKDEDLEKTWATREKPNISFSQVAGLENVKEQLRLKLIYPFTQPDFAKTYKINSGGGILLYGPPGTGKTMIARAVAGEIDAAFFAIKPSEIMSKWVGEAEQNIAQLFREAEAYPISIIFIDEMESLAPQRRSSNSSVMARVVPQILAELDGFTKHKNPILTIGATNEPWILDPAVLRPGRLDRLIYVPPPDYEARLMILKLKLDEIVLAPDVSLEDVAMRTQNFSGADMTAVVTQVTELVFSEAVRAGVARPINRVDFERVLSEIRPSISEKELSIYEHYHKTGELKRSRGRN